jgi:beta-mannosidase
VKRVDLASATWTVEACFNARLAPSYVRGRAFPARVPGCVHSDLIRAGVIGHPNIGCHEADSQWIGRTDWRYQCRFDVDRETLTHDRVDLVIDGMDTVATLEVNGQRIGTAMNMHHAHRFNITPFARAGDNMLMITLRGPVAYAREQERLLGSRPVNGDWTPYCYIRKMASNFQWDWGPQVATCGIWRSVRLEAWSGARIDAVRPMFATFLDDGPKVVVEVDLEISGDIRDGIDCHAALRRPVESGTNTQVPRAGGDTITASARSTSAGRRHGARLVMRLPTPTLWWPRGYGQQALHDLHVEALHNGAVVDVARMRVGLRETRLSRTADKQGESFAIAINDVPIFCKGANWIPEGLFPEDQTPQRIRERVQMAADANMNMLRVWGGGAYEQDAFYEACDERGIMVWQDFMFACATYPEDDPYPQLIEREARETVSRLCSHPSIVLWCGGNENILGYESWGWKQRMPRDQKWGERYYLDLLPHIVNEHDPSRSYWPDSPYSGARDRHPNDAQHGDRHTWDAKAEGYRDIVPRFCSEFGHQSPPCWATMKETWGEDQLFLDSRAMQHRQRATGGNDVWYGPKVMGGRWREPMDFDEWLYQAHLMQARAITIGIEWLRSNRPQCMGALFWQFNDAWAGHSWSCIDSAGRRKPLWYAVRRAFAPQLLCMHPIEGKLRLSAINDTSAPWETSLRLRRMHMDGRTYSDHQIAIKAAANAAEWVGDLTQVLGAPTDSRREFIVAETERGGARAMWFFDHDRELALPSPRVEASVERRGNALHLTLHSHALLRDAVIAVDRVDPLAEIDDNLFSMLPGETRRFRITTQQGFPAAQWIKNPVFRCANEFSDCA